MGTDNGFKGETARLLPENIERSDVVGSPPIKAVRPAGYLSACLPLALFGRRRSKEQLIPPQRDRVALYEAGEADTPFPFPEDERRPFTNGDGFVAVRRAIAAMEEVGETPVLQAFRGTLSEDDKKRYLPGILDRRTFDENLDGKLLGWHTDEPGAFFTWRLLAAPTVDALRCTEEMLGKVIAAGEGGDTREGKEPLRDTYLRLAAFNRAARIEKGRDYPERKARILEEDAPEHFSSRIASELMRYSFTPSGGRGWIFDQLFKTKKQHFPDLDSCEKMMRTQNRWLSRYDNHPIHAPQRRTWAVMDRIIDEMRERIDDDPAAFARSMDIETNYGRQMRIKLGVTGHRLSHTEWRDLLLNGGHYSKDADAIKNATCPIKMTLNNAEKCLAELGLHAEPGEAWPDAAARFRENLALRREADARAEEERKKTEELFTGREAARKGSGKPLFPLFGAH